ncbi:MAG: hypothetical protein MK101_08310 [Phycisphaerales bacterium]|nr:hypothetical protein [Phycisphaerales bacterium]
MATIAREGPGVGGEDDAKPAIYTLLTRVGLASGIGFVAAVLVASSRDASNAAEAPPS